MSTNETPNNDPQDPVALDEVDQAMQAAGMEMGTEPIEAPVVDDAPSDSEPEEKPAEATVPSNEGTQRKAHKALQEFDVNAKEKLELGDELILPANFDKETRKVLEDIPNVSIIDNPEARNWANTVGEGLGMSTFGETFVPTLEDEKAEFRQQLAHNNTSLAAAIPKHKAIENENLKGERAVIRMITHLGLGTLFQVPLWHSGMWVTFKPPTESEILELNRVIMSDKIQFGRNSYGLVYSNVTAYTIDRLIGFALSHVYDITVKADDINIENLRNHISFQDIPSLLWGFVCTMYPRGFKYRRACVADPEKCNYILEETLNLIKLQWTNGATLTEWQKTHMSSRQSKIKDGASVKRYTEELTVIQKTRIEINKDKPNAIAITIKTPTISDYIDAGHRWIGDIVSTVDEALATDPKDNERNNLILQYGRASAMRQYSHWIDSIDYETNTITDRESTVCVIGIPVFDCPHCNKTNEGYLKLPAYKNIIPLDMVQVFFGLLTQRLERIAER